MLIEGMDLLASDEVSWPKNGTVKAGIAFIAALSVRRPDLAAPDSICQCYSYQSSTDNWTYSGGQKESFKLASLYKRDPRN